MHSNTENCYICMVTKLIESLINFCNTKVIDDFILWYDVLDFFHFHRQKWKVYTVALCLSFTFLWYDMVWYSYAMVCYFCAMLWDIQKWYYMICNRMVCYAMLWDLSKPFFFHTFCILNSDLQVFLYTKTHT